MADRRFGDAEALVATGDNARANGAQYLAGIVVEILLKGQLLRGRPRLSTGMPDDLSSDERFMWGLVWRSHDLSAMLDRLPRVRAAVERQSAATGRANDRWLTNLCATWTIHARYSPMTSTIADAGTMVERVRWLKEIIK